MATWRRDTLQLMAVLAILGASLVGLVVIAAHAGQLLIMACLGLLAIIGAFFLLALLAGHVRLGARQDAQALLALIAEETGVATLVTTADGSQVYANVRFREFAADGRGTAALVSCLSPDAVASECLYRLMRAAERGEAHVEQFNLDGTAHASRQRRMMRISVAPLSLPLSAQQRERLSLWQIEDVTAQKAEAASLRQSYEARLAQFDAMPAGLLIVDGEGQAARINATLAGWLGMDGPESRPREAALGLDDVFSADGAALLRAMAHQRRGETVLLDLEIATRAGVARPVHVVARMAEGDGVVAAVILQPARPDTSVQKADSSFARLYQAAPFGFATLDGEARIVTANAAFARMFLDGADRSIRRFVDLFGGPDDRETRATLEAALSEARAGRRVTAPIDITVGPKREFTRRLYVTPLGGEGGGEPGAVLYVIDATEQKELERRIAQIQKMDSVGELAGGIAHDFNNVLTAIIGFSDLLLERRRPTDPAYADIVNIKSNANRAAEMVKQLLAFARQQTLNPKVLSLNEVISDFSFMLSRYMTEKVELRAQHARDLWLVKADKGQFEQVLMNLAINARDAMPNGGSVTIRTRNITERESAKLSVSGVPVGEYVLCEVSDTGVGMTPDVLAKIFDPFFTTKEVGKGTGLGLAQVYGTVKQTGGYIFADSTPGVGTTFRIYLPRHVQTVEEAAAIEAEREAQRKPESRDLTGSGRVLLVEDEDAVRNFAARALRRQGYEVIEAACGADALAAFAAVDGKVDIVVSDVLMPEMDGPTLLRELHKLNPGLRIIFVSGYPDDAFKAAVEEGVSFAFLQKPFTLPQLAAKVKEELGR